MDELMNIWTVEDNKNHNQVLLLLLATLLATQYWTFFRLDFITIQQEYLNLYTGFQSKLQF